MVLSNFTTLDECTLRIFLQKDINACLQKNCSFLEGGGKRKGTIENIPKIVKESES
jgi:hypothetical protein